MKKIILLVLIGFSLSVNAQNQKKKAMPTKTTSTAVKKPAAVGERKAVVYQVFTRLLEIKKQPTNHGEPSKKTALENLTILQIKHFKRLKS